jgi:hypothetical protein
VAITALTASAEATIVTGSLTLNAPASPQNGDVWIAVVHTSDQNAMTMSADWTQIYQGNGGGTTSRLAVFWHRYAGVTPSMVVTHSLGVSIIGGVMPFRGVKSSGSPVNATSAGSSGTDASIEIAALTTTKNNCMLVVCDGAADDNNRSTLPTGFTAGFEDTGGGTQNSYHTTIGVPNGSVACHYKIQGAAGGSGTFVDTMAASDPWASVMFALEAEPVFTETELSSVGAGASSLTFTGIKTTALSAAGAAGQSLVGVTIFGALVAATGLGDLAAAAAKLLGSLLGSTGGAVLTGAAASTGAGAVSATGAGLLSAAAGATGGTDLSAAGAGAAGPVGGSVVGSDLTVTIGAGGGLSRRKKVIVYDRV